jgi:hypothetical protein
MCKCTIALEQVVTGEKQASKKLCLKASTGGAYLRGKKEKARMKKQANWRRIAITMRTYFRWTVLLA